jgi:hypothetical protein
MKPTAAELGRQVRHALWAFTSRTSTRGTARDRTAISMVRSQYPATRGLFSDAALAAVLREPQANTCSWDAYRILATANDEQMPSPSPALQALLGSQCSRCRTYFEAQEVAQREHEHTAGLVAAGFRPEAAGRLRTPEQVDAYTRSLRSLENAKLPPRAPTGAIWSTNQRPKPPSYYRPGRPTGGRR